jgi:hypothetical protein
MGSAQAINASGEPGSRSASLRFSRLFSTSLNTTISGLVEVVSANLRKVSGIAQPGATTIIPIAIVAKLFFIVRRVITAPPQVQKDGNVRSDIAYTLCYRHRMFFRVIDFNPAIRVARYRFKLNKQRIKSVIYGVASHDTIGFSTMIAPSPF